MKDVCNATLLYGVFVPEDDEYKELESYDDCYQIADTPYVVIKKYSTFNEKHVYIAVCYSEYDEYDMDTCHSNRLLEEPSKKAVKKFKTFCKEKGLTGECGYYVAFDYN